MRSASVARKMAVRGLCILQLTPCNSGGEMQRLGFARLFYHRPRFAIMDESTSALDTALEASCMRKCNELNITCISVAHRPSLLQFHKNMLQLDSQGGFRMVKDVQGGATAQR